MDIDAKPTDLKRLFVGRDVAFKVPPYQRNYSWSAENSGQIEQLWDDVIESFRGDKEYFMGPFVLLKDADEDLEQYDIIDGQQRLTTFTMMILLIYRYSEMFVQDPTKSLFGAWQNSQTNIETMRRVKMDSQSLLGWPFDGFHYYLTLNKKDRQVFRDEILGREEPPYEDEQFKYPLSERIIKKAYKFLATKIRDHFLRKPEGPQQLKALLKHVSVKLKFLRIDVKSEIDAYLLFEGLNYKGMTLSVADLLKNRVLMTCAEGDREEVATTWDEIAVLIEGQSRSDFAEYIRTYWNAFYASPSSPLSKKELYGQVKQWLTEDSARLLVSDLRRLAPFYVDMTPKRSEFPSSESLPETTDGWLLELAHLQFSVCNPLILYCKSFYPQELTEVAKRCLNYLFRVITIGGLSVSVAKTAMNGALRALKEKKSVAEALSKIAITDMPDATFIERIKNGRFNDGTAMRYLLFKIVLQQTAHEFIPISQKIQLEHILPQKPERSWQDFIVPDGTEIDDWIYSVGNMTLLIGKKNASGGNKPFSEKVEKYQQASIDDPEGTRIAMTYKLHEDHAAGHISWTADRIAERAEELAKLAPQIWPLN